jgi:alpha-mannosidase
MVKTLVPTVLFGAVLMAAGMAQNPPAGGKLRIISSSHQDIAWMDDPETCRTFRDVNCITPALELMAKNPDYRFVMENMLNLVEYVERHPERKAEILKYTREGRLEWGATFVQPYESLLSGEQLVRQAYFGRRWLRSNFPGCDALVYFNPDVPGRSLQMSQILAKSGIPYMVISRFHEGFYRWGSPDGSSVLAYSPGHYGNAEAFFRSDPKTGVQAIGQKLARWSGYYAERNIAPEFPLLHSQDFSKPSDFGPLIKTWNESRREETGLGAGSTMIYSSAREMFEALSKGGPRFDAVSGERPGLWLYIHGPTHQAAIAAQREAGRVLPAAEIFNAVEAWASGNFRDYPTKRLSEAWLSAIYPDHGWGGKNGQITDRLFRKKYEFARDEGRDLLAAAVDRLSRRIKTEAAKGTPISVFNALSWPRTDPCTVAVKLPNGRPVVRDAAGRVMPSQILPPEPGQAPDVVRIMFAASAVPPVGYKTFYVSGSPDREEESVPAASRNPESIENSFYRIALAPGGMTRLFDKTLGREILKTEKFLGFEIFTLQSVGNGAGEFGRVQQPTMEGFDKMSLHRSPWVFEAALSGHVRRVWSANVKLPTCTIRQRLIVYDTIKRIDCEVDLLDWDGTPYREWRIAVPAAAPRGKVAYEVPLGVVEVGSSEAKGTGGPAYGTLVYDEEMSDIRPREVQNFLNVSDENIGLTLSTDVAVNDFKDPTSDPAAEPILQGVLLASRRSCHGEGNWYLQEGDHQYRFSLTSHAPGWRNGYKAGIGANMELSAVVGSPAGGPAAGGWPEEMSFASLSTPNVLFSTIKKAEDDDSIVVRVYDLEGKETEARLELFVPPASASHVNMIEDEEKPIRIEKDGLKIRVGRYAIETVKIFRKTDS